MAHKAREDLLEWRSQYERTDTAGRAYGYNTSMVVITIVIVIIIIIIINDN